LLSTRYDWGTSISRSFGMQPPVAYRLKSFRHAGPTISRSAQRVAGIVTRGSLSPKRGAFVVQVTHYGIVL